MDQDITEWTHELHDIVREKSMVLEPEYIVFEPLHDDPRVTYVYVNKCHMPSELPLDSPEWEYQSVLFFWPDGDEAIELAKSVLGSLDRIKDAYVITIRDVLDNF